MSTLADSDAAVSGARSATRAGAALAAALLAGGCAVGSDFARPAPPAAHGYTREDAARDTAAADGHPQHFSVGAPVAADWWTLFQSPALNRIVEVSLTGNPTLEAADASLRASQDTLRAGYGIFYPHVSASAAGVREATATTQQSPATHDGVYNLVTLGASVSYALDVFGGQRRAVEALGAQTDVQRYTRAAATLTLSANVVNTSIARAAYVAEAVATRELIGLQQQQLATTTALVEAGAASYSSLLSVQTAIATSQAELAPLAQRQSAAEHLLATLEGVGPAEVVLADVDLTALVLPADLPLSLPSELVRQRPDILAAEAEAHAASAGVGVATAAMFPSVSVGGAFGAAGAGLSRLSGPAARFWSVGPLVDIPLFQGGSLWYGRKAAIESYRQSLAVYRQTVLGAFAQVADALTALQNDADAVAAQSEARRTAADALRLLEANYRAGLVAYLDVLVADGQFHQATIAWLGASAQRAHDTVALYVALGGGSWQAPEAGAAVMAP